RQDEEDVPLDSAKSLFLQPPTFSEIHHVIPLPFFWIQTPTRKFYGGLTFRCASQLPPEIHLLNMHISDRDSNWTENIASLSLSTCDRTADSSNCQTTSLLFPVTIGDPAVQCSDIHVSLSPFTIPKHATRLDLLISYSI